MTIRLVGTRREAAEWIGKIQHLIAGVPLLFAGLDRLHARGAAETVTALVEILIAGTVLVAFILEFRVQVEHHRGHHAGGGHRRLGWFDLAAGALLLFEAIHGEHVKPIYERAHFYAGALTLAAGLFHGPLAAWLRRRRHLTVDETGLVFQGSRFRRTQAQWSELASVDVLPRRCILHGRDGSIREINLKRFSNRDVVSAAIVRYASAAGLIHAPMAEKVE